MFIKVLEECENTGEGERFLKYSIPRESTYSATNAIAGECIAILSLVSVSNSPDSLHAVGPCSTCFWAPVDKKFISHASANRGKDEKNKLLGSVMVEDLFPDVSSSPTSTI